MENLKEQAVGKTSAGEKGFILAEVMVLLVVMTLVVVGVGKVVQDSIGVSANFHRKSTTRSIGAAQAGLIMDAFFAIDESSTLSVPGLTVLDSNVIADIFGWAGNDIATDSADNNPDFEFQINNIRATGDIDFLQTVETSGGSVEFASAYDGVGVGQVIGSSFVLENAVQIHAVDQLSGARTVLRFTAVR